MIDSMKDPKSTEYSRHLEEQNGLKKVISDLSGFESRLKRAERGRFITILGLLVTILGLFATWSSNRSQSHDQLVSNLRRLTEIRRTPEMQERMRLMAGEQMAAQEALGTLIAEQQILLADVDRRADTFRWPHRLSAHEYLVLATEMIRANQPGRADTWFDLAVRMSTTSHEQSLVQASWGDAYCARGDQPNGCMKFTEALKLLDGSPLAAPVRQPIESNMARCGCEISKPM